MSKKNDNEKLIFKVAKGSLVPGDAYSVEAMRKIGLKIGDEVLITVYKPRSIGFNKFAHKLGGMIAANIEAYHGIGWHDTLKKIQIEAEIFCETTVADINGIKMKFVRAESLSFENMDEIEFNSFVRQVCEYVVKKYWHDLEHWQVEEMAANFVDPA